LFLYKEVLDIDLPWLADIGRPKLQARLPVVLSQDEAQRILAAMDGEHGLVGRLLYGTGMRIMEALSLRVKDVDFTRRLIVVREAKGGKDRIVMLPDSLREALLAQLDRSRAIWAADRASNRPGVSLPYALERKSPRVGTTWAWHWVFPQTTLSTGPRSGIERRHHLYDQTFQRAFKRAVELADIGKPATPHTMRHSFATQLLQSGYDIRTVQELLGHADVATTMVYTHVLNRGGSGVISPLDRFTR
jgi:integron integrase